MYSSLMRVRLCRTNVCLKLTSNSFLEFSDFDSRSTAGVLPVSMLPPRFFKTAQFRPKKIDGRKSLDAYWDFLQCIKFFMTWRC